MKSRFNWDEIYFLSILNETRFSDSRYTTLINVAKPYITQNETITPSKLITL